jgi:hypothetical protein
VRVAFEILRRHDFLDAARAYSDALKDAARTRNPAAYHETITLAFLTLIAERMAGAKNFALFVAANPDVMEKNVLSRWYGPEWLGSSIARRTFVLPEPSR